MVQGTLRGCRDWSRLWGAPRLTGKVDRCINNHRTGFNFIGRIANAMGSQGRQLFSVGRSLMEDFMEEEAPERGRQRYAGLGLGAREERLETKQVPSSC